MTEIINFWYQTTKDIWVLITQYWFLSASVIIALMSYIIDIVNKSKEK